VGILGWRVFRCSLDAGFRFATMICRISVLIVPAYWTLSVAEADASVPTSAFCYHVEENILVVAIVEAVLKLRKVERQIFLLLTL
jgi:hypothetical protein